MRPEELTDGQDRRASAGADRTEFVRAVRLSAPGGPGSRCAGAELQDFREAAKYDGRQATRERPLEYRPVVERSPGDRYAPRGELARLVKQASAFAAGARLTLRPWVGAGEA